MSRWPTVALGDCCEVVSGSTPQTSVPEYWDGDIPWATPKDLSLLDSPYISHTSRNITRQGLQSCAARVLPCNSVLLSSRAPIGYVAVNTVPMATNQGFKSLVPDPKRVHHGFLYHWLVADKSRLQSLGNGATFKEISKSVVEQLAVPVPPLFEQRRIAAILDQADTLRAKRRIAVAKLQSLERALFADQFGDLSAAEPTSLEELLIEPMRNGTSPSANGTMRASVLTLSAITGERFNPLATKVGLFEPRKAAASRVCPGIFLVCRGNGNKSLVGAAKFAPPNPPDALFPDTMIAVTLDPERVSDSFMDCVWRQPIVRRQIERGARTSNGTWKINQGTLGAIAIPLPPVALQQEFAGRVGGIRRLVNRQRTMKCKVDALFASLQHAAFSGAL
ncbi:MAG TPA: restriction endonuclease subunit S [Chloroflexota bacterium]|nr:restriction endonuclease subunit S [Chloroflexota bacterium]